MSVRQLLVFDLIRVCGAVTIIDATCVIGCHSNGSTIYLTNCVDALRELVVGGFVRNNVGSFTKTK